MRFDLKPEVIIPKLRLFRKSCITFVSVSYTHLEADDLTALDAALAQIETDGLETVLSEQGKALLAQLRAAQTAERAES